MDNNQTKIIELLREVHLHLIAYKEIERLNLRIAELESQHRQPIEKPTASNQPTDDSPSLPKLPEMLNEHQVADYLSMSVATVRRWRLLRQGPKFVKIGASVRYKREGVETWLDSCPGMR